MHIYEYYKILKKNISLNQTELKLIQLLLRNNLLREKQEESRAC